MKGKYSNILIITLVMVLTVGILAGCGSKEEDASQEQKQGQENNGIPVETIAAETGEIVNHITVTGSAEAVQKTELTPELQETAAEINVNEGQEVQKGEVLVQLDQTDVKSSIAEAKAGLESAQAGLEELLAGTREEEIAQLTAQLEEAKANYEQARNDYQRYKKLFEREAISKQKFESIKTQYISAESNYKSAQESLRMAENGPTEEQIKAQRAQVQQAQAQLNSAQLNLDKTLITAPFDGIVGSVNVDAGEMVGSQPIVSLVDLNAVEIQTYVSENNVNRLKKGQDTAVDFNALEKKMQGEIKSISPALNDEEQAYPVEIEVSNGNNLIKSGMYAEIKLETERSKGNVVIPKQSLLRENGNTYVFVVEDNKAVRKEVKIGLTTTEEVEILSGIETGTEVITQGTNQVTEGNDVRVAGGGEE
ncbi:MAG: efflux RND transporter periplasmic adaptor subunit [Halanaerobacter sp.]